MKFAFCFCLLPVFVVAGLASADVGDYTVKKVKQAAPDKIAPPVRKLLGDEAIQYSGKDGKAIAEFWFAKVLVGDVKVKNKKIAYSNLPQAAILGAVRLNQVWSDYRKQMIPPGVYTLRYASQPQDGDHMGTAPQPTFCVLIAVKYDKKTAAYPPKELAERSAAGIGTTHPAVMLLFPAAKATAQPKLAARPNEHMILATQETVSAGGKTGATLNLGLTLVGHASE